VHEKVIQEVLELRKNFWKYETFGEEHANYLRREMITAIRATQIMVGLVTMIVLCLCLSSITNKEKSLPLHTENSLFQINKINYSPINDFFTGGELNFYL
jgi:hypothetical protein